MSGGLLFSFACMKERLQGANKGLERRASASLPKVGSLNRVILHGWPQWGLNTDTHIVDLNGQRLLEGRRIDSKSTRPTSKVR